MLDGIYQEFFPNSLHPAMQLVIINKRRIKGITFVQDILDIQDFFVGMKRQT